MSSIANNGHLIVHEGDSFNEQAFVFKRIGINRAFSFDCFCARHDSGLFKVIENGDLNSIDFKDYKNCLLFVMRGVYNELNNKRDIVRFFECLMKNEDGFFDKKRLMASLIGNNYGKKDINEFLKVFWRDLNNGSEAFTFKVRRMKRLELCLSSSINYETTDEMVDYRMKNGKEIGRLVPIFINFFPLKESSLLLFGYYKSDHDKISEYIDRFFGYDEKLAEIGVTNLILFQCGTWVCSEEFFLSKMKSVEDCFSLAKKYACDNTNERRLLHINLFSNDFERQIKSVFRSFDEYW